VVAAVSADEADASAVLVREDSPSVDLLLVDPAVAVKRFADLRRGPSEWCTGREVGGAGSMARALVMDWVRTLQGRSSDQDRSRFTRRKVSVRGDANVNWICAVVATTLRPLTHNSPT
jgi:hypothetical protein